MPKKIVGAAAAALAPLLSAALLVCAFPRIDLSGCVWVGLVPLLVSIAGRSLKRGFFLAYACGIFFFTGVFSWGFEIPGYHVRHHAILAVYLAVYFGVFGWTFALFSRRLRLSHGYLCAPLIWVCLEYARSNLSILSLPWPLLSHAQYLHPPIIQIADLTGAYGVSFLIVLVNATIAAFLHPLIHRYRNPSNPGVPIKKKEYALIAGIALFSIASSLAYGYWSLSLSLPEKKVNLAVVQGNIDREKKRNPRKHAAAIMQRYTELSERAAQDGPDLIIWPEAATPGLVLKHMGLYTQLRKLIVDQGTHFLVGSSEFPKYQPITGERPQAGNTALYFSPQGKVLGQYLKIRLLPFGEYIPFEKTVAWPKFIIDTNKNWDLPGKDVVLFELNGSRFGVVICWENAFAGLFRQFVKNGAQFMVNITNEGWFGESAAPYQFLSMSVFRAVENQIALARASNNGVSCFIDPRGRIIDRVQNHGKDIYVDGYLTRQISVSPKQSFYTRVGDLFVAVDALFVLFFAVLACKPKKQAIAGNSEAHA